MTYLFSIFTHVIAFAAGALAVYSVGFIGTGKDANTEEQHSEYTEPRRFTVVNGKRVP